MNRTTRIDHAYLRFECRLPVGAVRTGLRAACTSRAFGGPGWSDGRLALFRPARTARCPACRLSDSAHRSRRPARPQPDRRTPARTGRHRARPAPGGQRQSSLSIPTAPGASSAPMRSATAPTASRSAAPTARSSSAYSSTRPIAPNRRRACAWCWVGTIRRPSSTCISSPRWPARLLGASAPEQQRRPRSGRRRRARPGDVHHARCTAPT